MSWKACERPERSNGRQHKELPALFVTAVPNRFGDAGIFGLEAPWRGTQATLPKG